MEKFNKRCSALLLASLGLFFLFSLPSQSQAMDRPNINDINADAQGTSPELNQALEQKLDPEAPEAEEQKEGDSEKSVSSSRSSARSFSFQDLLTPNKDLKWILKKVISYLKPLEVISGINGVSLRGYWVNPVSGVDRLIRTDPKAFDLIFRPRDLEAVVETKENSDIHSASSVTTPIPALKIDENTEVKHLDIKRHPKDVSFYTDRLLENTQKLHRRILNRAPLLFPKIEHLEFCDFAIPSDFFHLLLSFKNLKKVALVDIDFEDLETKLEEKLSTVTQLSLRDCIVSKTKLSQLLNAFDKLKHLDLRGSYSPGGYLPSIWGLLSDEQKEKQVTFPDLPQLEIIESNWKPFFSCFGRMDQLQSLRLKDLFFADEIFDSQKFREACEKAALYPNLVNTLISEAFHYPPDTVRMPPGELESEPFIHNSGTGHQVEQILEPFSHLPWAKKIKQSVFLAQDKRDTMLEAALTSARSGNLDLIDYTGEIIATRAFLAFLNKPITVDSQQDKDLLEALFQFIDQDAKKNSNENDRLRIKRKLGITSVLLFISAFEPYRKTVTEKEEIQKEVIKREEWVQKINQHLQLLKEGDPVSKVEWYTLSTALKLSLGRTHSPLLKPILKNVLSLFWDSLLLEPENTDREYAAILQDCIVLFAFGSNTQYPDLEDAAFWLEKYVDTPIFLKALDSHLGPDLLHIMLRHLLDQHIPVSTKTQKRLKDSFEPYQNKGKAGATET